MGWNKPEFDEIELRSEVTAYSFNRGQVEQFYRSPPSRGACARRSSVRRVCASGTAAVSVKPCATAHGLAIPPPSRRPWKALGNSGGSG